MDIGTTEMFQGREKKVVLVSTVRSRLEDEVPKDIKSRQLPFCTFMSWTTFGGLESIH